MRRKSQTNGKVQTIARRYARFTKMVNRGIRPNVKMRVTRIGGK